MSPAPALSGRKAAIWLVVGLGVLLFVGANGHLVHVAMSSQPDCVAHVRAGEGRASQFGAAKSSCAPLQTP